MASYTVKQTVVENLNADLDGKQPVGDYPTNASLTEALYKNITNCITEIPQDIKLKLNNGVLTLKAGSKVWMPDGLNEDGSKKFNCAVVSNDISRTVSPDNSLMFFYDNGALEYSASTFQCFSGETVPTTTQTSITWYDTATNYIKSSSNGGQSWSAGRSLPICIISNTTTIDQVFNGFGYIGSTAFALPGVKGLAPNGRNADGSLMNQEIVVDRVCVTPATGSRHTVLALTPGGIRRNICYVPTRSTYVFSDQQPTTSIRWFNTRENKFYLKNNGVWQEDPQCWLGIVHANANLVITSMSQFKVEHLVTQSDMLRWSGIGMPSFKYIDLTLGAAGSKYTAPANGWLVLSKNSTGAGQEIRLAATGDSGGQVAYANCTGAFNYALDVTLPVKKGTVVNVFYSTLGTTNKFRFIYAEGEQ